MRTGKVLAIAAMAACAGVHASDGTYLHYYVGAQAGEMSSLKSLSVGYQDHVLFLATRLEGGGVFDRRRGGSSSAFGHASVGVEPEYGPIYMHFFQGVGLMTSSDAFNSGYLQFFEDFGIGFRDREKGVSVGLSYKHISNAGLSEPNKGRDLIGLQVMIPW